MTDENIVCPKCGSKRIVVGKKKCKCLDCHKSFKPEKKLTGSTIPSMFGRVEDIDRLMRRATIGERYGRR